MRPLVLLSAAVLPVIVLGAGLSWLGRPQPAPVHRSTAIHDQLMATEPEVVLLGASKLSTDIDRPALAKALGIPPAKLVTLGLSGTSSPVWYTVLENRVVRPGHKPKLIVVYSTLDWMLSTDVSRPGKAVIDAQRGEAEPVLQAKVFKTGVTSPFWERVEASRGSLREAWLAAVRDHTIGATFGEADTSADAGRAIAGPALEHLFGVGAAVVEGAGHRAIPVVEHLTNDYDVDAASIEDTLAPDLVALAKEAGAHIVFVRAPVRADSESLHGAPPALEEALVAMLNAAGEGYIDLRDLHLPSSAFGDTSHVGVAGRGRVTAELAARLNAMNALDASALPEAEVKAAHAAPTATRIGHYTPVPPKGPKRPGKGPCDASFVLPPALAPLGDDVLMSAGLGAASPLVMLQDGQPLKMHAKQPQLREDCAGLALVQNGIMRFTPTEPGEYTWTVGAIDDLPMLPEAAPPAWWVHPGAGVRFDWTEAWTPGPRRVHVAAWAPSGGAAPEVVLGATRLPMTGSGSYWSLDADLPEGEMSVEIHAADSFVLLQNLWVGTAEDRRYAIGDAAPATVQFSRATQAYAAPPPTFPTPTPTDDAGMASWDMAFTGVPDAVALVKRASVAACSPFVVTEDGTPLAEQVASRQIVLDKKAGRYAQAGTRVVALGSDGSSPLTNGRTYAVSLLADRKCRGMRWMYAGDVLTITWAPSDLPALPADPTHLELAGGAVVESDSTAALGVVVWSGDTEVLRTNIPLKDFPSNVPLLAFPAPLSRNLPVKLELRLAADSPWLLLNALGIRTEPDAGPAATPNAAP